MRPSELDLGRKLWNIPRSRTKNGHPHSVPLSWEKREALELWADRLLGIVSGAEVVPMRSRHGPR